MMEARPLLSVLIALLAGAAIYVRWHGYASFDVLKPMTTVAIITLAAWRHSSANYHRWLLAGLLFALLGDIFLLRESLFLYGLGAFLMTHLCFSLAILRRSGPPNRFGVAAGLGLFGLLYYGLLYPGTGPLWAPAALYFSVILGMAYLALGHYVRRPTAFTRLLALAALLFLFSDALIGYTRFVRPLANAELLILASYWGSIYLFAQSAAK